MTEIEIVDTNNIKISEITDNMTNKKLRIKSKDIKKINPLSIFPRNEEDTLEIEFKALNNPLSNYDLVRIKTNARTFSFGLNINDLNRVGNLDDYLRRTYLDLLDTYQRENDRDLEPEIEITNRMDRDVEQLTIPRPARDFNVNTVYDIMMWLDDYYHEDSECDECDDEEA